MQTKGIEYLVTIFKDSSINQLCLGHKKLYTTDAKYLASFLKEVNLIDLNLNCNYIGDEGVKYLAPSLKNNTIMYLNLGWNNIKANGAKYLAEILSDTQLIYISLCNNCIGVDGAKYLANGLKYSQVTNLHLHGNMIKDEGYQYLKDVIDNTNLSWANLNDNDIEVEGLRHLSINIPRGTTTIAYKISNAFKELVSLNPLSNEFEFIVPRKNAYPPIEVDQYVFLIKTLNDNSNFKVHIFDMCCKNHNDYDFNIMNKITEFITTIADKFNIFINDKLPALTELFSKYNYVNLVKQFEDMKYHDIVKNLLLHRELYYVDDRQEILHPYIYKMLHKYGMILYNVQIEPNKKDEIISYYSPYAVRRKSR
ncbi:MAG: hypothetical protein QMO91_04140 [Candidatus Tisiphia sp.]|nr:hypothetical protein [Candidatus Tisiphia sp.]